MTTATTEDTLRHRIYTMGVAAMVLAREQREALNALHGELGQVRDTYQTLADAHIRQAKLIGLKDAKLQAMTAQLAVAQNNANASEAEAAFIYSMHSTRGLELVAALAANKEQASELVNLKQHYRLVSEGCRGALGALQVAEDKLAARSAL